MSDPSLHRLRVEHIKQDRIAYLGHLEMLATLERCIRRAGLPFAVSNGFAKHMKVQFSQAIPVGASSTCEYFDVFLTEHVPVEEAFAALENSTPRALAPQRAGYIGPRPDALEKWLSRARWTVSLRGSGLSCEGIEEAARLLVERGSFTFMRGDKQKTADLAATFVSLKAAPAEGEGLELVLETRSSPEGALRPAVFIDALVREYPELAGAPTSVLVARVGQWHENEDGSLEPAL